MRGHVSHRYTMPPPQIAAFDHGDGWGMLQADSLRWLATVDPETVDAFITDPPYSSGGQFRGDRNAQVSEKYQTSGHAQGEYPEFYGDTRDARAMVTWLSMVFADAWRATKPEGVLVTFTDWRMLPTMTDAIQAGGWVWRGIVPWYKPNARRQLGRFAGACEYALWGSKGPMPFERGVGALGGFYQAPHVSPELRDDLELPPFVASNSVPGDDRQHVTEKPVGVMRELIKIVPTGGLICDPFTGSGTTGIAALVEGRKFIGCEMSPDYFRVACDRFRALANLAHRKDAERGQIGLFAPPSKEQ
jgi:site-specific DNA-methyltransferase (adenine-specific)